MHFVSFVTGPSLISCKYKIPFYPSTLREIHELITWDLVFKYLGEDQFYT